MHSNVRNFLGTQSLIYWNMPNIPDKKRLTYANVTNILDKHSMSCCTVQNVLCRQRLIFRNSEIVFHTKLKQDVTQYFSTSTTRQKPEIIVIIHCCNIFLIFLLYFFCYFVCICELWKVTLLVEQHMNIWYPSMHSSEFFVCMFTQSCVG
jgi:hypothetical protein